LTIIWIYFTKFYYVFGGRNMCILKKLLSTLIVLIFTALSVTVVFAADSAVDKTGKISFKEIEESFKERLKNDISLDEFEKKEFDGCYGNQLTPDSKAVYDVLEKCIEKSKDGVSDLGLERRTITEEEKAEDGTVIGEYEVDIDVVYIDGKKFDEIYDSDKKEVREGTLDFIEYAKMAFDYDHPEVFWLDWKNIGVYFGEGYDENPEGRFYINLYLYEGDNYYCDGYTSKSDVDRDISKINEICGQLHEEVEEMDTYNKISRFNEYLVRKNEYNRILLDNKEQKKLDSRIWKAVSALIYGSQDLNNELNPVCEGYSRAFKILCDYEGIECVPVSGLGNGGAHMWNYVKVTDEETDDVNKNGKWYGIDVTWNDPVPPDFSAYPNEYFDKVVHRYFLIGSKSLTEGGGENQLDIHIPEVDEVLFTCVKGLSYPVLEEEDYVYNPGGNDPDDPEKPIITGDVDNDGLITMNDASELLNLVLSGGITDYHRVVGNLDKTNNNITAADVALLVDMVRNSEDTPATE